MYAAAVQRQGGAVSVEQLEEYIARPERKEGTPTRAIPKPRRAPASPLQELLGKNFADQLRKAGLTAADMQKAQPPLSRIARDALKNISGASGVLGSRRTADPDDYTIVQGAPDETTTEWLCRLGWLERRQDDTLRVTPTGRAVLGHLEHAGIEDDTPVAVVLDPGDELVMARVMGEIAVLGEGALVDAYFSVDHLPMLVGSTKIDRVLTGTHDSDKLARLEVGLEVLNAPRRFEVRKSAEIHDRYVIPDDGPVWSIGTSLTGVGSRFSLMVRLDDQSTFVHAIRNHFETMWADADVVGVLDPDAETSDAEREAGSADPGSESGDEGLHEGDEGADNAAA